MIHPDKEQVDIALDWLRSNEGDNGEAEACRALADWAEQYFQDRWLRIEARYHGVPVAALLRKLAENRRSAEIEANARLIAAAPDMLAALKELIRFVDSVGSEHINRVPFAAARAAIAKAESRS
jgi:hypothetical protein